MCNCKSYNKPEWGGTEPEVVLKAPEWSGKENGICVDACIAEAIQMLWDNGIITLACCCGHNLNKPNVVIGEDENPEMVKELLGKNDGRDWDILQWRLLKL